MRKSSGSSTLDELDDSKWKQKYELKDSTKIRILHSQVFYAKLGALIRSGYKVNSLSSKVIYEPSDSIFVFQRQFLIRSK